MSAKKLRCAIYTRKSTDEGLDQSFNSIDAQREACAAFILSQAGEGWSAAKASYDDGGFSGGSWSEVDGDVDELVVGRPELGLVDRHGQFRRGGVEFFGVAYVMDRRVIESRFKC